MNRSFVQRCKELSISKCLMHSTLFRFAVGGAASRVLKTEFNLNHLNKIVEHIFESLRSLNWIEVS